MNLVEIIIKKRKNLIVVCIDKHPTLNNQDFIDSFMLLLLENFSMKANRSCLWESLA